MNQAPPPGLVICEGKEDRLVIERLARKAGIPPEAVAFEDYDGEGNLRKFLQVLKAEGRFTSGELKRVLVTRDADNDPAAAWSSLSGAVNSTFNLNVVAPGEWQQVEGGPQIAAWLIPAQGSQGMIETLCMNAATGKSREAFACLDPFVACLENRRQKEEESQDAKIHEKERFAYWTICGQASDPRKRLSLERAIDRLDIDWDHQAFAALKAALLGVAAL